MLKEYVLITGATGFIGSHVAERLVSENQYQLVAVVRKNRNDKKSIDLESKGVILFEGSFYDKNILEKIFNQYPIQTVIHIAALRGGGAGTKGDYYRVNVFGTEVLLKASLKHKVEKFIFCSSVGVFGTIPMELPPTAETELNGDNDYHESKILAEKKVQEIITRGLDAYIIRPTITYGRGDNGFATILVSLVRKKMLLLPFTDIKIHLLDVNSLVDLFIRILRSNNLKNRVFFAADMLPVSLKELADLIHSYYHKTNYPSILKLPNFVFNILSLFFKLINNEKWWGRILFISRSWYYDISDTVTLVKFKPAETKENLKKQLFYY